MDMRKQRRSSKSAAVYIPLGSLLIILLTILGISSFLRIMVIEVEGATRYSTSDIISVSGIQVGDNLMFIDLEAAERRIVMAMPFVRDVNILRLLPDGVKIEVEESEPIAAIAFHGEFLIVDITGRILERTDSRAAGLIEVRGVTPVDAVEGSPLRSATGGEVQLQHMRDVLAAFDRENITAGVTFLDVTHIAQISFGYIGRFRVVLGGPSNLRQKLSLLPGAIERINEMRDETATGTIDLSDPAGEVRISFDA